VVVVRVSASEVGELQAGDAVALGPRGEVLQVLTPVEVGIRQYAVTAFGPPDQLVEEREMMRMDARRPHRLPENEQSHDRP
jgi:hypothetical protein